MVVRKFKKIFSHRVVTQINSIDDRYIYTGIICLIQLSYGLSCSVFGPSFVDLKHIFNTSMDEISLVTTFMSLGYMIGSLCGLIVKKINKRMSMISSLVLMSVIMVLIPYSGQILQLYSCFLLFGFGSGVYVNVKYVWLIDMWQTNSAPVLHLAGFMFGIGHTLGPLIEKPYLTGERHLNITNFIDASSLHTYDSHFRRTKLLIPYLISGTLHSIGPLIMMVFCSLRYRSGSDSLKESLHNINNNNNNNEKKNPLKPFERMHSQRQRLILIILVSLLLSFFSASESAFFAFSATYFQYIPLKLSASRAAELVSLMALTFTLSRGMAVIIAIKTKPHNIIAIFLTILLISLIILFFASNSLPLLRFGILTMSFGFSPIYASIFSLMGRYVEFTSQIGTVLMLSANSLNLILPYILGKFIEENPNIFLLTLILNITFSVFIFISIIYFVYQFKQNTYNQKNYEITDHPNVL